MTGIEFAGLLLLTLIAVAGLSIAWSLHDTKLERHGERLQWLEDRVAMLEIPEVVHRATEQHMRTQALLGKAEGRA